MFVIRTHGVVAATLGALALGACAPPEQNTDLRPAGPPEVLAVLVMTDAAGQLVEKATYCQPGDEKRPGLVGLPDATTQQVCPEELSQGATAVNTAYPDGWYIRVMFDELLDPSIEELTEIIDDDGQPTGTYTGSIVNTHPVNLECQNSAGQFIAIDYDGYYSPAGNAITWPVGPSIVIKPNEPKRISTNTACRVTINDVVVDKDGEKVPSDQKGPFTFGVAPIQVIFIDPPDDPDFMDPAKASPIPAQQIYFDNPYLQFNTFVDIDSLCPDADGDGLCDNDSVASIRDVAHPSEGPGFCSDGTTTCGSLADCPTGSTVCGKGYCGTGGEPCNVAADCPTAGDQCGTLYAYAYAPFGLTEAEFGIGPPNPIQTEHNYTFSLTQGAVLKDRCGNETTLPAPSVEANTLVHFTTDKYDFVKTSILSGETAPGTKRLQFNWNNVPGVLFAGGTDFTMTPLPKYQTAACSATTGCALADVDPADLPTGAVDGSGQILITGFLSMDTQYTATLKAGVSVPDFYGAPWTNAEDKVITWKTAPAIQVTSLGARPTGGFFSTVDGGTLVRPTAATTVDFRIGFNQDMDPTTIGPDDYTIEPAPTAAVVYSPSGCGSPTGNPYGVLATCTLRVRAAVPSGSVKFTLKAGASFKDIFGVVYTQAADKTLTITVEEAPTAPACF